MKKAFVFDFDDTLATTGCVVLVRSQYDGKIVDKLTPAEYNYKSVCGLPDGHFFDFSQFKDDKYIRDGQSTFLMDLAKEVHDENHDVYVLTARGNAVSEAINLFLMDYGICAKHVHCVGDSKGSIAKEKGKILFSLMQNYDRIYFYDDHAENVKAAEEIGCKSYKV
jgi:acid phosphatase class B